MLYILIILIMIRICTLTCIEYVKKMLFVCKPLAILNHKMYDFLENGMESFYEANMNKKGVTVCISLSWTLLNIIDQYNVDQLLDFTRSMQNNNVDNSLQCHSFLDKLLLL